MIRFLRRSRLLALALLLAAPALGGAWLQALHPCPVDAPWAAGHGSDHGGQHGGDQEGGGCQCVSACTGVATAALAAASELPPAAERVRPARPAFPPAAVTPAPRSSHRLPPSTAPPLA